VTRKGLFARVAKQAGGVCEYCRLPQAVAGVAPFNIEHIVARQHGGATIITNLALACGRCNRHKGPNIAGLDPESGAIVPLFNPRKDQWDDHFIWMETSIVARTPIGRTTVQVLALNAPDRILVRQELAAAGEQFAG
jgi:5-methylcytosine-specific restriction endonuclease McrA